MVVIEPNRLVVAEHRELREHDLDTGEQIGTFRPTGVEIKSPNDLFYDANGDLWIVNTDDALIVWEEYPTGVTRLLDPTNGLLDQVLTGEGQLFVTNNWDGEIREYDWVTGKFRRVFARLRPGLHGIAVGPRSLTVAGTGSDESTVILADGSHPRGYDDVAAARSMP
jgi:hypothetical protein